MGGLSVSEARDTLSDIVSRVAYTGARGLLHRHRANGWPHSHARQNRKRLGARSRVVRKIRGRAGRSHCKAIRPSFERSLRAALAPPAGFADRLTAMHEKSSLRIPAHPQRLLASETQLDRGGFGVCDKNCARIALGFLTQFVRH